MKKIIGFICCIAFISACSDPKAIEEPVSLKDSTKTSEDFFVIESTEKGVNLLKGFWYNPEFFDKVKTSKKVKDNLKGSYQYFYLNDEGLVHSIDGYTAQDYIPISFAVKSNALWIYDHNIFNSIIIFKNDSIAFLKTMGLDKDTLNVTLKKTKGNVAKMREFEQYQLLLGQNSIAGKYENDKGEILEFKSDGKFKGFDLMTEYSVNGLAESGLQGIYEFDTIDIKNGETLITYKWTLENKILTLTEVEMEESEEGFRLSPTPITFTKK